MKHIFVLRTLVVVVIAALFAACSSSQKGKSNAYQYHPDNQQLHDTIVKLDSIFFGYYNTCNVHLAEYAAFYSDSLEFYHDTGGLMTSKKEVVDGTEKYVCGKVTRHLVPGSIEVYSIKGFGAIEMGLHSFVNHTEKNAGPPRVSRFIIFWQHTGAGWKIKKVVSLH